MTRRGAMRNVARSGSFAPRDAKRCAVRLVRAARCETSRGPVRPGRATGNEARLVRAPSKGAGR
ncbi:hypothetical protein WS62_17980 [Burkholderia sp. ABCPW 14]|nr:hypothetical protein WS62_17980 [Burkholderia sp. ABCPW 14]